MNSPNPNLPLLSASCPLPILHTSLSPHAPSRFTFADGTSIEHLKRRWLCRGAVITQLWRFLGCSGSDSWPYAPIRPFNLELIDAYRFVFVHGPAGTGKSQIIQDFCSHFKCPTAYVDCVGTNSIRCVFESVLNQLARHVPCEANSYTNYCRCDDMSAFLHYLKKLLVLSLSPVFELMMWSLIP